MLNAEAVLFVCYDKAKGIELNIILNQCMSADYQLGFAAFQPCLNCSFVCCRNRAGQQLGMNVYVFKIVLACFEMLLSENFRRCHKCALIAVFDNGVNQCGGDCGFSRAYIAL